MSLTDGDIRSLVIECLRMMPAPRSNQAYQVCHLLTEFAKLAKSRQLTCSANNVPAWLDLAPGRPLEVSGHLTGPIQDIVWDLIVEGILRPGAKDGDPGVWPCIHLTPFGAKAIQDPATPYDPDGFLQRLRHRIPNIDPIIVKYIAESALTLRHNCLLSSTITLGCASEKAFLLLVETYCRALNATDQATFEKKLVKAPRVKQQHQEFMKEFEKLKPKFKLNGKGSDWLSALEHALDNVFSYFRDMRNDAGHPTGITFERELVLAHLTIFPYYLRSIYDLMEWIADQKTL